SSYYYYLNHYLYSVYDDVQLPADRYAAPINYSYYALRNLMWSDPSYPTGAWKDRDALYDVTQWALSRKTVDGVPVAFAAKGGNNAEHHNHNDVGSFLLDIDGEVMLGDLGAGLYNKRYFSAERYEVLVNGSQGHPVPMVNGKHQVEGEAACANNYAAVAGEDKMTVTMDMAPAYAMEELASLQRELVFCKASGSVTVKDTFAFNGAALPVTERIPTKFPAEVQPDGTVIIRAEKAAVKIACSVPCEWKITEEEYEESPENLHQRAWLIDAIVTPENGVAIDLTITKE
ncbi:MAG: heparinase II/III family protein, partial [Clostridia bacterium]|nr:heparinase II/III family protein [Clostridia bacterium]